MKISEMANQIRMIKPIHKLAILIFTISLIYNATTSINDYNESQKVLSSYRIENCQSKNVGHPDVTLFCIEKMKSEEGEWALSYIQETIAVLSLVHIFLFPLYLIIFNIVVFIFQGYRLKYKFLEMNFAKKFIHVIGLAYAFVALFVSYVAFENIYFRLKVPVVLFRSIANIDDSVATVTGVWVKDIYENDDITLKNVANYYGSKDDDYSLDSHFINCSRNNMTCTHTEMSLTSVGSSIHLQPFEQSESNITEWGENYIRSEIDNECFIDKFTFIASDYKVDSDGPDNTGVWLRVKKDKLECSNHFATSGGYKLWDGIELDSKLMANERGQLLKSIVGIFD